MICYPKKRITYNRIRLALFLHSHCAYVISSHCRVKSEQHKNARFISRLSQVLDLDVNLLKGYFILGKYSRVIPKPRGKIKYIVERQRILIYLEIEKEIISIIVEKKDSQGTAVEDYHRALLEPAIERVAGNHLKNIKNDYEFDLQLPKLTKKYCRYYYTVARKYNLPTPGLTPFVTRLINI